jgi:hypothetical protein
MLLTNHIQRIFALLLLCSSYAAAISSRACKATVGRAYEQYKGSKGCRMPICGALDQDKRRTSFLERLPRQCRAVMERYRVPPSDSVHHGFPRPPWAAKPLQTRCATSRPSWFPTNPVVVESPDAANFIMCTVPKVACSSFRKLLNTVIRSPDPAEPTTWDQIMKAHFDYYPTVWHYTQTHGNLTDTYPTFTVGRNPYVRLLSGFLNKMVFNPHANEPHDAVNLRDVNLGFGRHPDAFFWGTRESFSQFIDLLIKKGTTDINDHFKQASLVCDGGQFQYEYYLRLEDMHEWFPCWEAGLRLEGFTRTGWKTTSEGKMHSVKGTECWWKPPGATCEEYYSAATAEDGSVQPVREAMEKSEKHDEHDTHASDKWRTFYTQEMGDLVYEAYKPDFLAFGYERELFGS